MADTVAVVLDLSDSMRVRLPDLRKVIGLLIREQFKGRCSMALVAFGSKVKLWRPSPECIRLDDAAVEEAVAWLDDLETMGSTNTLDALKAALTYDGVQAVYLVSDGRPDQAEAEVLSFVEQEHAARGTLFNTLSFSCTDLAANAHLGSLAEATGGTFQYFAGDVTRVFLEPGASEMLGPQPKGGMRVVEALRAEVREAKRNLRRFIQLYHECQTVRSGEDIVAARADSGLGNDYGMVLPPPPELKRRSVRGSALSTAVTGPSNPTSARRPKQPPVGELPPWDPSPAHAVPRRIPDGDSSEDSDAAEDSVTEQEQEEAGGRSSVPAEAEASTDGVTPSTRQSKPNEASTPSSCRWRRHVLPSDIGADTTTEVWLRSHSVRALRLTLLDVLKPTAVRHRAAFDPALRKTVHAKVLAEAFPYYEMEAGGQVWFVNPAAARLDLYLADASQLLELYRARLESLVIEQLSADDRSALRGLTGAVRAGRIEAAATEVEDQDNDDVKLMVTEIRLLKEHMDRASELQAEVTAPLRMGTTTERSLKAASAAAHGKRSSRRPEKREDVGTRRRVGEQSGKARRTPTSKPKQRTDAHQPKPKSDQRRGQASSRGRGTPASPPPANESGDVSVRKIRIPGLLSSSQLSGGLYREGTPVLAASYVRPFM